MRVKREWSPCLNDAEGLRPRHGHRRRAFAGSRTGRLSGVAEAMPALRISCPPGHDVDRSEQRDRRIDCERGDVLKERAVRLDVCSDGVGVEEEELTPGPPLHR